MDQPRARLAAEGLAFRYGDRIVLEDISFAVSPGEIFGILGPNGAGKSTLFSILTGLLRPASGSMLLDGEAIDAGARALRARLGVVFQQPSLDIQLTATENLVLGGVLFGLPASEARRRAERLLAAADLTSRANDAVKTLSGGMRRRLELARAVIHEPSILILDEPTTGLDARAFEETWQSLEQMRQARDISVLLTTHRPDEAEHCDRLAIIHGGRIVACESPASLRARVSGDVIAIEADGPEALANEITATLGLPARVIQGEILIERDRGHEMIPRIVEAFAPGRLRAISLHQPTLADAFLKLTGQPLTHDLKLDAPATLVNEVRA